MAEASEMNCKTGMSPSPERKSWCCLCQLNHSLLVLFVLRGWAPHAGSSHLSPGYKLVKQDCSVWETTEHPWEKTGSGHLFCIYWRKKKWTSLFSTLSTACKFSKHVKSKVDLHWFLQSSSPTVKRGFKLISFGLACLQASYQLIVAVGHLKYCRSSTNSSDMVLLGWSSWVYMKKTTL